MKSILLKGGVIDVMWAAIRWAKSSKHRGPYPHRAVDVAPEDVPPGVAAARVCVGINPAPMGGPVGGRAVPVTPSGLRAPVTPSVRVVEVETEAGEGRFRARTNGPWIPNPNQPRVRGSAKLAEDIASSSSRTAQAVQHFQGLIYAPSTSASKEALFGLWTKICKKRGVPPLPLSAEMIIVNSAILREAGYRAVMTYVNEAKERHLREGFGWSPQHQAALADARRASKRLQGDPKRAEEVKYDWWIWLAQTYGRYPDFGSAPDEAPCEPFELVVIGQQFLLREVEASALFLDTWTVKLDVAAQTAGLFLPVSKSDQSGHGVLRTLACTCGVREDLVCPFHALIKVVKAQLDRFGFTCLEDVPIAWLPLFGQKGDPSKGVSKASVVKELQRLAGLIASGFPQEIKLNPEHVSGHSLRRGGIKALGRKGVTYVAIQWLARHSSAATLIYLEEAYEECPNRQNLMVDALSVGEMLNDLVAKQQSLDNALNQVEASLNENLSAIADRPVFADRDSLRLEMRKAMIPHAVVNSERHVLHLVNLGSCFETDPHLWSTKCGWHWLRSNRTAKPLFDEIEAELCEATQCSKCYCN